MNDTPDEKERERKRERDLNPSLRDRKDTSHDTSESTRPPAETASVQRDEGRHWPIIWLAVTVVGVLLALYILFW